MNDPDRPAAELRLHGPQILELKARLPLAAGTAQRVDVVYYLPAQLQIDAHSLPRDRLLRHLMTHTRYQVRREGMELLDSDDSDNPIRRLEAGENDAEYEIRMFCNLFHSALKDELRSPRWDDESVTAARRVLERFFSVVSAETVVSVVSRETVANAREYLYGTTARRLAHRILDGYDRDGVLGDWLAALRADAAEWEIDPLAAGGDAVLRDGALKKWVQSLLYLDVRESNRNQRVFHVLAGVAAGTAMAVAIVATVFAEQRWAGGSLPWAIALVGAYIIKDRIKEMLRGTLVRLVPGFVQDRVNLVFETDGTKVARKVALLRYPDTTMHRGSEAWRPIDLQKRFVLRRRVIQRHRRVDAIVEIMRFDCTPWTGRMDRAWKEWPTVDDSGELVRRTIPRYYEVFVQVSVSAATSRRDSRNAVDTAMWYRLSASRDRVAEVVEIPGSPFDG